MGLKAFFVVMAVVEMYWVGRSGTVQGNLFTDGLIVVLNVVLYFALPRVAQFLLRFGVKR